MTNNSDWISLGQRAMDYINAMPNWLLLMIGCLIVGYICRAVERFPNDAIPVLVVAMSALGNAILCGGDPHEPGFIKWTAKNVLVGIIIGYLTWRLHKHVLKPLEVKFPWLKMLTSQTRFITRKNIEPKKP